MSTDAVRRTLVAMLILACGPALLAREDTLRISVLPSAILVTGATPRSLVALFGVANEPRGYYEALIRQDELLESDSDGTARIDFPKGIPERSVWFAVDIRNMQHAVGSPRGFPLVNVTAPDDFAVTRNDDWPGMIHVSFDYVEIVLVQPGRGAWRGSAARRGSADAWPGQPGIHIDPTRLRAVGGTSASPAPLGVSDLVIAVEPLSMQFVIGRPGVQR